MTINLNWPLTILLVLLAFWTHWTWILFVMTICSLMGIYYIVMVATKNPTPESHKSTAGLWATHCATIFVVYILPLLKH